MAVKVNEKKAMLKTIATKTDANGNLKKRNITLRNINTEATNDNLYELSNKIAGLVDGSFAGSSKITEEVFGQ